MDIAYLIYEVRDRSHRVARGPVDSRRCCCPSRIADRVESAGALLAYRVIELPPVRLDHTLEVCRRVLDAVPRGLFPLVDGGACAGVPLLGLAVEARLVALDVLHDVLLHALNFVPDLLLALMHALHAARDQAVQLAVLDAALEPGSGEGVELRRVDAADPRLLLLADAPLARDGRVAVGRVELDVGLEVVVHLLDGLDDLVHVEVVARPHEVALALLDELADLLPLVAVVLEAPRQPGALEEGEEARDDGVERPERRDGARARARGPQRRQRRGDHDLQEVAPVDDDGEDLEAVLGLLLRVHHARVEADVGGRTRPQRAD